MWTSVIYYLGIMSMICDRPSLRVSQASPPIDPFVPIRAEVDRVLAAFVSVRSAELAAIEAELEPVAREVGDLIAAGGKRLRPAFVYWGHRAGGGGELDHSAVAVAAAVEMLHTFALLHDDVMDRASIRRGRRAAARGFADAHVADGLVGDAQRFGASAAVLAGDVAMVWADQLLDTASADGPATSGRVRSVFAALRLEVMAGQYLDLRLEGTVAADPEMARRVALLKSGRYTVTRPLELGLALAGADDPRLVSALAAYGDAVGVAFQQRDDILGLFGDPATTGKGCVDDLRAGKRTMLVLHAMSSATPAQQAVLGAALGDRDLGERDAERCREIVASSGALAAVERFVRSQHAAAIDAIVEVPQPAKDALVALAAAAVDRAN
jgi:geranylgeranyl diphosphate synthase type I